MGEDSAFVQECMNEAWMEVQSGGMVQADFQHAAWEKFIKARDQARDQPRGQARDHARDQARDHVRLTDAEVHSIKGVHKSERRTYYAAAIIVGLIFLGSLTYRIMHRPDRGEVERYALYDANPGHSRQVVLSDGSVAILFPGSTLRVPENFGRKERRVLLSGRGYFNVKHNEDIPFYTEAAGLVIKDIGTSFEINASGTGPGKILLKEGRIGIHYNQESLADLLPGQQMEYDQHAARWQVTSFDTAIAFSWLREELNYDLSPLEDICADLQKWYGVRIHIPDEKLRKKKLTVQFTDIPIEKIMDILSGSSGFSYRKTGNDIIIQ